MARDEGEDEDSSPDIPSFEDLVEELERFDAGSGDLDSDDGPPSVDSAGSGTPDASGSGPEPAPDDESWDWIGEGSPEIADGSSTGTAGVENLWNESTPETQSDPDGQLDASKITALVELIEDASNVLVVGPENIPMAHDLCSQLCDAGSNGPRRRLLISTDQTAEERMNSLRPYTDQPFDETFFIVVGEQARDTDGRGSSTQELEGENVVIETLHDSRDLTRLGVLINKYLGRTEPPPTVCFHTLTELLQFVGVQKLFRFLHVLQGRVRSVDARAHYQIDPRSIDEQTISTLKPLFDFTITYDDDGTLSVDQRG